ncbi:hypothetical protein Vadar_013903 [Vaccinium darrowii]|uniref:Uncharacterized protein n=1 Tax=Vaccinium darrowii TaxID=229202 RepID=A0ACB7ZJH2_9ERIC|nr:hypothetical protein Vadar_013903 [Vaccinium darrowii]
MDSFPESETTFLPPGVLEHCFILVDILSAVPRWIPFKFFSYWMKNVQFKSEVQKSWGLPISGPCCYHLYRRLTTLKLLLRSLNRHFFSRIGERVHQAREELAFAQEQCAKYPFNASLASEEKALYAKFIDLSLAEESFNRQKSRVQWLAWGIRILGLFIRK